MLSNDPLAKPTGPIRILIADDHEMARAGIRSLIGNEPGLDIIGEAVNGSDALAQCGALQPDLALLDVRMPDMDGIAATRAIKQQFSHIKILIVTMHENVDYLVEAVKAGAGGYVLKDTTRRELITAIRQVCRGETFMNPRLMMHALRRLATEPEGAAQPLIEALTPREVDVLRLLVQGQTNRQIAANLAISPGTVKVHVEHIIGKLSVSDRTQAAVRAIELRLV